MIHKTTFILLALVPLIFANSLVKNANQLTLQELLASQGIKSGQVAIILIAPQNVVNTQQTLGARALQSASTTANAIQVQAPAQAINVHYKSQSVPLNVQHTHIPAPTPETKLSRSEEEPHRLVHEIIRPVIQEVREIIQPYRRIIQEIRPVKETVVTNVATQKNSQNNAHLSPTDQQ